MVSTTVPDMPRLPAVTAAARATTLPAATDHASAAGPVVAEAAFVTAITVGKQPSGWDPQEVWLDRVHRPRQRRRS